ncbi:MAG: endonuclease/exonuclease/phosphatase family protein [Halofilum sp. (in: g-proteobacteria)]|nr:endonuclease/exonuclease/phosphatase family protein [Halofilum sp. (in: g-proteobacteria)]
MAPADGDRRPGGSDSRFRLLSYNIQVGIQTSRFREYLTGGWKHVLPHGQRLRTLAAIADQVRGYDLVAVQEADAGSLRTGFICQTEYLARRAGYPWWGERTNRRLGRIAQHSIGAMARVTPAAVHPVALPGRVRGRGALLLDFGEGPGRLSVVIVHLALGRQTRQRQLDFVAELISDAPHAVVMGDFNAQHGAPEMRRFFARTNLVEPAERLNTWPAWRPLHNLDHILTTSELQIEHIDVLDDSQSDHLPLAVDIALPKDCRLAVA